MNLFENLQLLHESEYMTYKYDGPYYRFGKYYGKTKEPLYTEAPSLEKAKTNFIYRLKKMNNLQPYTNLTIDVNKIEEIIPKQDFNEINDDYEEIKHEPLVNDSKYNFDDDDREDEYEVENLK